MKKERERNRNKKKTNRTEQSVGIGRTRDTTHTHTHFVRGRESAKKTEGIKCGRGRETEGEDKLESLLRFRKKFLPFYKLCSFILSLQKFAVGLRYLFGEPRMKHIMKKNI